MSACGASLGANLALRKNGTGLTGHSGYSFGNDSSRAMHLNVAMATRAKGDNLTKIENIRVADSD
jgi:hypothetical protein